MVVTVIRNGVSLLEYVAGGHWKAVITGWPTLWTWAVRGPSPLPALGTDFLPTIPRLGAISGA